MEKITLTFSALYILLSAASVHALDCPAGTKAKIRGEINNNGNVALANGNGLGEYTLGVAELTIKDKSGTKRPTVKLTCALLGEPRGIFLPPTAENSFDHMISCSGPEVAFETRFVDIGFAPRDEDDNFISILSGNPVLSEEDLEDYCGSNATIAFVERAEINGNRDSKGIFAEAEGGLNVFGCVNATAFNDMGEVTESVINMRVSGKVCLPNW